MASSSYVLEVVGGEQHGARLKLDGEVRTIGRAREADLVLRDPAVSRRHVQVVAGEGTVSFVLCADAVPFVVAGRPLRAFDAKAGDRVLVGDTLLVVVAESGEPSAPAVRGHTDVRTLLTGAAADVQGLAAAHALVEAVDDARDLAALEAAVGTWAAAHLRASVVKFQSVSDGPARSTLVDEASSGPGWTTLSVPVPCGDPLRLAVTVPTSDGVTDSVRRILVVAGRILGATASRIRLLHVAEEKAANFRSLSVGSAKTFLGESPDAKRLARLVPRLAASDINVLIEGETGVGKTFVARLVHEASARAREPLRIINCAAVPDSLFEGELFGHERGAFTGAVTTRTGAFEAVGRGTLLLDELGELSSANQAKLLRVLEEKRFERIGSNHSFELQARVICATNRDLEEMTRNGAFRLDLFYRISAARVRVPPLRERGEDLILLAEQILTDAKQNAPRRISGFSPATVDIIRRYEWPGNVRELRNVIDYAVALGDGPLITPEDLPAPLAARAEQSDDPDVIRLPSTLATVERRAIEGALRTTGGNRLRAAALLGIKRSTLYNKLKEYDIS